LILKKCWKSNLEHGEILSTLNSHSEEDSFIEILFDLGKRHCENHQWILKKQMQKEKKISVQNKFCFSFYLDIILLRFV